MSHHQNPTNNPTRNPSTGPSNPPTPRPSLRPSIKPTPKPTSGGNVCCTNRNLGYQTCDTNNWCNASSNNCNTCGGVVMEVPLVRNGCCTWVSLHIAFIAESFFFASSSNKLPNREGIAPLGIQITTVAASTSNLTARVTAGELGSSFKLWSNQPSNLFGYVGTQRIRKRNIVCNKLGTENGSTH